MKDSDLDKIRQQAQSETTDQNTLCRLAHSKEREIRGYVAANPNTPMDMLKILGREFPQVVIHNPVFKKLFAEQPEDEFVRLSLARISTTPTEKLEQWSGLKNQTASFYLALVRNSNNSARGLDLIVDNCPHSDVYLPILRDSRAYGSTLEKIVFKGGSPTFVSNFIWFQHPNITSKIVKIAAFFTGDNSTEPNILFELIEQGCGRARAFIHPNMSAELLYRLSFVEDLEVKIKVATHPKTQEYTLSKMVEQDPSIVGCHVAIRLDLAEEFALKLTQDSNQQLLQALLLNPQISGRVLKALLDRIYQLESTDFGQDTSICQDCGGLRKHYFPDDRDMMARAKRQYGNLLDDPIFLRDDITFTAARTREKLVGHRQVTIEILERLSRDRYLRVRKRVAQSKKINFQISDRLAQDPSCEVRELVAKNPLVPSTTLARLKQDPCGYVRRVAANNMGREQKIKVAKNLATPINTLEKLLRDSSCPVEARIAIAIRKISPAMMLKLAQDRSVVVRSALAKNPLISEQIAANLAQDLVPQVTNALLGNPALTARVFNFIFEQTYHEAAKPQIQEIDLCYHCCPSKYHDTSPFGAFNPYDFRTSAIYEPAIHGEDPISAASRRVERFAKHPLTTVKILQQLKNSKYSKVRETVASSPIITKEIVNELAQDLSCWVRANLAKNQVTPRSILEQLGCDRCFNVRLSVAKNPQTSLASLRNLMYDRESQIADEAMKNINSPRA